MSGSLLHCHIVIFAHFNYSVRGNLTKNDKQLSPSTVLAPSLEDARALCPPHIFSLCDNLLCVCEYGVTCFSGVGRRA